MTIASVKARPDWRVGFRQKTARTARWLHIYLSMVSFAVVLFFAVTGLTLNHPDWFARAVKTRQASGVLAPALVNDTAALVRTVREREHLHGALDEPRTDDREVSFSLRAPGYSADVTVERADGSYTVLETRNGFVAVMNDLHKGQDSGTAWKRLIDVSAILLALVSFTGLVILWFIYRRRASGLLIAAVGLIVCGLMYKVFVP